MNIIVTFKVTKFRRKKLLYAEVCLLTCRSDTSNGGLEN